MQLLQEWCTKTPVVVSAGMKNYNHKKLYTFTYSDCDLTWFVQSMDYQTGELWGTFCEFLGQPHKKGYVSI